MKVAIMQPYFFPYLGYFQLIAAVDVFVIYDDVNYINRGWINRNAILANGQPQRINLALGKSSQNLLINQIEVVDTGERLLKTLAQSYGKAPHFNSVFPMLEQVMRYKDRNLGRYLAHLLRLVCDAMGIQTRLITSSSLNKDNSLKAQEKILAICQELHATQYVNSIGGTQLYEPDAFLARGMQLSFLQSRSVSYVQFGKAFTPNLSIIDVLMFNDLAERLRLLAEYDLR
ncbi:MAG: WbqC family protein [Rhodoferax sp.]